VAEENEEELENNQEDTQDDIAMDEEGFDDIDLGENKKATKKNKLLTKKNMIIGAVVLVLASISLIAIIAVAVSVKNKNKSPISSAEIMNNIQKKQKKEFNSKLARLIQEADELYKQGKIKEALKKYEEISNHERYVSFHNIGVSYMREGKYKEALKTFEKSLKLPDNLCMSSINSAVSALHLKDIKLFNKYIKLAEKSLRGCVKDPLYHYYYALVLFYQNKFIEALAVLKNNKQNSYPEFENKIKSNISLFLNDNIGAISDMEKQKNKDYIKLGLMYSRIGEYQYAIDSLQQAEFVNTDQLPYIKLATVLNYIKLGQITSAKKMIEDMESSYGSKSSSLIPIHVILNKKLFEQKSAKKEFNKVMNYDDDTFFKLFMYFSPYKILNNDRVINYIRRGEKSIFVDNIEYAKSNFKKSRDLSKLSSTMTKGVKYALQYKIRDANKIFKSLIEEFGNDATLHYNLALSYAHLGQYYLAKKHFNDSFYFDNYNVSAKILAMMSSNIIGENITSFEANKLMTTIDKSDKNQKANQLYSEVARYFVSGLDPSYLKNGDEKSVLSVFFKTVLSAKLGNEKDEEKYSYLLKSKLSDNLMANTLHFFTKTKNLNSIDFAREGMFFIRNNNAYMESLYYGPIVGVDIYIRLASLSGMGYYLRDIFKERIITETHDIKGVLGVLAFTDLYLNFFEESFVLYNKLIDDMKVNDSNTLFLAAVSAIGSNHKDNAAALLELAILDKTSINLEARYALGLLYLEFKNLESSKIQFDKIKSNNFSSKYFDFKLDKDNI